MPRLHLASALSAALLMSSAACFSAPAATTAAGLMKQRADALRVLGRDVSPAAAQPAVGPALIWSDLAPPQRNGHSVIYDPVRDRMILSGGYIHYANGPTPNETWALSLGTGTPLWQHLQVSGSPPPNSVNQAAFYDPVRDRMIMVVANGYFGVWALSLQGLVWQVIAPAFNSSRATSGYDIMYDSRRDRILSFGGDSFGLHAPVLHNDVWALPLSGGSWTQLTGKGTPPAPRTGSAAVYDSLADRIVIYGGSTAGNATSSEMWALDLSGDSAWVPISPQVLNPGPRSGATFVLDKQGSHLVELGGGVASDNTIWSLDLASLSWKIIAASTTAPSPRLGAALAFDSQRGRMLLQGGGSGTQSGETWAHTLVQGSDWASLVQVPPPFLLHTAIFDPIANRMIVFGGVSNNLEATNDTWAEDLGPSGIWIKLAPRGSLPSSRLGAAAVYEPAHHRMILFGGEDPNDLNDVWELSLDGRGQWTQLFPTGTGPQPRSISYVVYDPLRGSMILFGGYSSGDSSTYWRDTWELSLGDSPAWTELHPSGAPPPGPDAAAVIYDPIRDRMILFGGLIPNAALDTTWALNLGANPSWSAIPVQGSPGARWFPGAVYDPAQDRMVVMGGFNYNGGGIDDVWALPLSGTPQWVPLNAPNPHPEVRGYATFVYDGTNSSVVQVGGEQFGQGSDTVIGSDAWALPLGDVPTPALPAFVSAEFDGSVVHLQWLVSAGGSTTAIVYRNTSGSWAPIGNTATSPDGDLVYDDRDVTPGQRYGYRLGIQSSQGEIFGGETWVETSSNATWSLSGALQNPSPGRAVISFSLPDETPATLELFDVTGKRVAAQAVHGAGPHVANLSSSSSLEPGIYFARLARGSASLMKKVCVVP